MASRNTDFSSCGSLIPRLLKALNSQLLPNQQEKAPGFTVEPVSSSAMDKARKAHAMVLVRLQDSGIQAALAVAQGVSESTISRIKNEKLEDAITLLVHLGFKVVSESKVCVDRSMYQAMVTIAGRAMSDSSTAQKLVWEDE